MKSFDSRLENDLFPETPEAFRQMITQKLGEVCGGPEEKQAEVVRISEAEAGKKPGRKLAGVFGRIGAVAAAAVLVIGALAAGMIIVFARRTETTSPITENAQAIETVAPEATPVPEVTNTVYAATVDEFLAAIASDTEVILTGDVYNLSAATDYGVDGGNRHMWREVEDGYELVLCNLENFRLVGSENTVIETDPRHAGVLEAENCTGLVFQNLTVGHTQKPEKCSGEVIRLTNCTDTRIDACALYGCGSWGITAWYSGNLTVTDSEIYECSSGALHIWECTGVQVNGSTIRNCGGGGTLADLIYIQDSDVSLLNCDIYENTTESSLIYVGDDGTASHQIVLLGTDVHDNQLVHRSNPLINYNNPGANESTRMTVDGCAFRDNGDNRILPGNSRVFDLDGNALGDAELAAMTLERNGSEPTKQPSGTDACGTFAAQLPTPTPSAEPIAKTTVSVSTVEELLAAIAPNTEIVLAAGVYDVGTDAQKYTEGNEYCTFDTQGFPDWDPLLVISGVENLCIRAEKGAEVILTAPHKNDCHAVISVIDCPNLTISGVTVTGNAEHDLLLESCADVRLEGCTLRWEEDDAYRGMPIGIGLTDCGDVTVSNCKIENCASAIFAMRSRSVTFSGCEISGCMDAMWMSNVENTVVTGCSIHDCRNGSPSDEEDGEGEASYLISIDGISDRVLSVTIEDCAFYNNDSTFFFAADGIDEVALSGLRIHDNGFSRLFEFEATSDVAGRYAVSNCDVDRNRIGTFLFCGQPDATVILSGTSIADNEIETVFYGGVTVSGCLFANPGITRWIGADELYEDLKTVVRDADGNELSEADLWAMTLKRDE